VNPEPDEFDGKGKTLHDAAADAWDNAKKNGKQPGVFEIKKIEVVTENPIREYRVKIKG
jgi:flavin-binding protein dodecin